MNHKLGRAALLAVLLGCSAISVAADKELQVWIRATNDSKVIYDKVAEAFQKKTGIKIEYFNTLTDFESRLARAAAGNSLPDVIFNDADLMGSLVKMGILDEVKRGDIKGAGDVYDAAWEMTKSTDGKHYGVPTSAQSFALFIRKDWRTKLGLPVPKTWKDIEAMAKAFTEKDPDGNGKADTYGFVVPASTTRGYTSWFLSSFIWQAGGDYMKPAAGGYKPALATSGAGDAVKFVRGLICGKVAQPGAINATTADALPSFRSGQTGMFFSGPYHIALFDNEPGKDRVEVVAPPAGPKGIATLVEGTAMYLVKSGKAKAEARQFAEFMISKEAQEIGMRAGQHQPIVRLSVNKKVNVKEVYQDERWALFSDLYAKNGRTVPDVSDWKPFRQLTADGFNKLLSDCDSNVEAGLQQLDVKVAEELAKQGMLAK